MNKEFLQELKNYAIEKRVPIIRDKSAFFLQEQIKSSNAQYILEIGTAIGYSTCLIYDINPNAKVTTIELKEQSYNTALKTFKEMGISDKIEAINGDAMIILQDLSKQNRKFDFIFLDGPKGQYYRYLPFCKQMLSKGGIIFADNVYLHGMVLQQEPIKHKHRAMVNNLRKYLYQITHDEELETTIYDLEDGIAITKKR